MRGIGIAPKIREVICMPSSSVPVEFLRCPVSGQSLAVAPPELVAAVIARQSNGTLHDESGHPVDGEITSLLVRADGALAYPVRANIPVLLPGSGIPV